MDTDYHSPTPLRAVFDGAKDFGLTEDEVWGTVDASMYEVGRCQRGTNRFSSVEVTRPPRMTIAIGCSIS